MYEVKRRKQKAELQLFVYHWVSGTTWHDFPIPSHLLSCKSLRSGN